MILPIYIYGNPVLRKVAQDIGEWMKDNGMGMTEEVQKGLYEAFFTTKPIGKGTGLGMPITQDIVQNRHHGKLSFTSAPHQGTTFTISIPIRLK